MESIVLRRLPDIRCEESSQAVQQRTPSMLAAFGPVAGWDDAHLLGVGEARPAIFVFKQDCGQRDGVNAPVHRHRIGQDDTFPLLDLEIATLAGVLGPSGRALLERA